MKNLPVRPRLFGRCVAIALVSLALSASLVGCGGAGGGGEDSNSDPQPATQAAPQITTQPQSVVVSDGANASFSVAATGGALSYQWLRNGANIAGANAATYALTPAALSDTGARFAVVVSNAVSSVTSSEASLTVRAVAPSIATQPAAQAVALGATATFSVAVQGSAPLTYQWLRSGVDIAGATAAAYTTPATTAGDNGATFAVRVSNAGGQVTSQAAALTVTVTGVVSTEPRLTAAGSGVSSSNLVRSADGRVWAWGGNFTGKIGNGTTSNRPTPFQWPGVTGVRSLANGNAHSFVVRSDGTALGTGQNMAAQIGTGAASNFATSPTSVTVLSGIRAMAAGGNQYTVALRNDGTVWHWGVLPNGTSTTTPLQVSGLSNVVSICANTQVNGYALALRSDGTVWFWGNDTISGALPGQGSEVRNVGAPVQVPALTRITQVRCGWFAALALRDDGTVWSWGQGEALGNGGSPRTVYTPAQVAGLSNVVSIALWFWSAVAIDSAGSAWVWGDNSSGQLGLGNTTGQDRPQQVTAITNVVEAAAGYQHLLFLRSDGTVWASGTNQVGELGNQGAAAQETRPVEVPGLNLI